ncbi:MAG: hypothetical protein MJZ36_00850 [Bacteroidaceae bacterium]|nr:hypothetical protein [Bacteroidaceae bacterium]
MKIQHTLQSITVITMMLFASVQIVWAQDPDPKVWDGTIANNANNKFAENGITLQDPEQPNSATNPYTIDNAKEFAYFMRILHEKWTGYSSAYYWKLTTDINLNNIAWTHGSNTSNSFQGHFDGGGYTISNVNLEVANNSNYGLFPTIQGASATNLAEVKNLNISNVTFTSAASRGGNTRLGGLAGYVKQACITNVDVSNVTFTYTNTITGTNQLGGAIGCMENNTTLDNVDVTGVTATFSNTTTGLYIGGIVGASTGTANTNSMIGCDAKTVKVTHSSNITGTTYIGGLVGNANTSLNVINNNTVSGQDGQNDGKAFDVSVSGTVSTFDAGGLLGYTTGGAHEIKNNAVSDVYITVGGNTAGGSIYLAGLVGYAKGAGSPNTRILMQGNTAKNAHVTMNGVVGHGFYMGGFLGYADTNTNLFNNTVASPAITITNDINAETYVGGAVGRQNGYTTIDGMTVTNGSITGPSTDKNVKNNVAFFVGGFIGQQHSSGTAAYQPNVFRNIAVTGININLEKYQPATTITNHKFAVGGIAGSVNAPNKDANGFCGMPENIIFKGGRIYAPYATTSPTVSNFNNSNPSHNTMTTEVVVTIDALDKAKTKTWYYSDYELGLSQGFLNSEAVIADNATTAKDKFHKNYTSSATITVRDGISYLTVNNLTFQKSNRHQDSERDSKTVLWWTNTAGYNANGASADMFTNEEQPIYPHQAPATAPVATTYPYYWYFFQGVSNANYVTDAVAEKIIAGIAGNKTEAAKDHPITLTISNPNENERGFDQRTISVVAKTTDNEGNVVDATTGISGYQWYVNGVANGTGTSINLTPHWKDGMGITVNALNGEAVVATATYTLAPGVLKTKAGSSEKIRSDINARGTKANPYIIDCENALRQWSYLSTVQTGTLWEGIIKPVAPFPTNQIAGHYGRAYYELGADITMGSDPFIPISHVGYGSDGTWGTYSNNFSFQGNFDGKGHKISGLKITWGAGQYKGNKTNIYHGLFGLVGHSAATAKWGDGSTTSNTVIQNLVIENATLTHDISNTTFSYKKSYGHITADNYNNCMVGVLAGIVAANTTVQNIEIRGSKITDEGSSDYSLATMGLFVGGAIGSVQAQYNNENIPTNTVIKNIVVGTDITLTKAKIQDLAIAQQGAYNVGGVIGRFASTNGNLANTQVVMPKYLLYTGAIKAYHLGEEGRKDAMISPVIAATRYSTNQSINLTNISKIWEGNNNDAEQLTVADALYYNFHISDASGSMHLVTEDYPNNVCGNGARAQDTHTDGNETAAGYLAQRYQGVNYNAIFCDAATYDDDTDGGKRMAIAILNSHDDVTMYWEWKSGDATPHMTSTRTEGAYIVHDEDTAEKYNVIGTAATVDKYYKWYIDGVLQEDEHSSSFTCPSDIGDIVIKAEVYENPSATSPIATTQNLVIKGEFKVNTSISKIDDTYTVGITRGSLDLTTDNLSGRINVNYQWYKGNAVNTNTATLISGETFKSITIDKSALEGFNNLFCHVTIVTTDDPAKELFSGDISQYVREANVVFLQLQDSFTDSNGVTHNKPASSGIGTVDDPVTSWANAYAKLKDYTVPTQEYVTGHGGTWTSEMNFDDEVYYLAHKAEYLYDTYKRDNYKRKVKPIDECTNNWDNNVIVLMGLSTDGYFNNSETTQHNVDGKIANKPVTITGQWDGTNYYGYLSNLSGDFSINADHKFQNMGLGVLDKDISATASIRYRIYAHRWNVHAGKGLLMGWAAALEWGSEVVPVNDENKKAYKITSADVSTGTPVGKYACDIAIMGGYLNDNTSTNPEMFEYINHGRDDIGQQIKIESGFWGPVCPGNRQTDSGNTINTYYTMGGPDHPAKTTITVDIDRAWNDGNGGKRAQFNSAMSPATVDIGCLLTGNHEGTMYADVTLNILSGNMGRMVNGIKGAQRRQIKNPDSFTTGGVYRHTVNYGTKESPNWTAIVAPAPDSYFGRGVLNFDPSLSVNNVGAGNEGVSVVELYCGGLGRGHNDGSYHPEVRSYFYGLCEVNIKGGTFYKTIYGSGAGGTNGIGTAAHHTDDDGLPYWKTSDGKNHVWYAPYEYAKANGEFVKIKVAKDNSEDENLTADGYVDLEKSRNIINITGGIFGSEEKPVSIYAGGNGETDAALINPSSTKVGDVKNTYNTPNHQAGNMYGATDGLTTQINISGDAKIYGSIYGGGKGSMRYYRFFLRAPDNVVAYNVENQGYTHIMEPGGDTYNKMNGTDWNNIINSRKNADRYLNLGQIYGNSKVTISGNVEVFGNVYGGGEGVSDITIEQLFSEADAELGLSNQFTSKNDIIDYEGTATNGKRSAHVDWAKDKFVNFPGMGKIFGNAGVEVSGNVTIHGNVYGGGKAGAIEGTSNVTVKGAVNIYGKVYGAGQGLAIDVAKDYKEVATIVGDAKVNLSENAYIWQDIFGGGEKAVVSGNTFFNMEGGHVAANIYGGGEGHIKQNNDGSYNYVNNALVVTSADISGDTHVNITGGEVVWDRTSMADEATSSVTTYTYSKTTQGVSGTETYTTTDAEITKETVKSEFESEGYTSVSVAERTYETNSEGVITYSFVVTRTTPATIESEEVLSTNTSRISELEAAGYTKTAEKTEETGLAKGEIVYWDPSKPSTPTTPIETINGKKYANKLFYDDNTKRFVIEHNIFGGGYIACNVGGTANVTMTRGLGDNDLTATNQWKLSFDDYQHPHFYAFGGGYGAYTTVHDTKVNVNVTNFDRNLNADTDQQLAKPRKAATNNGGQTANPLEDNPIYVGIYNNQFGIAQATVLGVVGGAYAGFVKQNTDVTVGGETFINRVYGGGFGQLDAYNQLKASDVIYSANEVNRNRENLGEVSGKTLVNVVGAHIYGSVYGGGAGVEATTPTNGSFQDFNMAEVLGTTEVNISNKAEIYGDVYGGGEIANVSNSVVTIDTNSDGTLDAIAPITSTLNIFGGKVFGNAYAGGKGNPATKVATYNTSDNSINVGKIFGNTRVHIYNDDSESSGEGDNLIYPYVYGDIYGGCAYGVVTGNTDVAIDGGYIGDNIFGGGHGDVDASSKITSANVNGNTNVTISGGNAMWNKVADTSGNVKTWSPKDVINTDAKRQLLQLAFLKNDVNAFRSLLSGYVDATFYDADKLMFTHNHNIYGGGNLACVVGTESNVTVNHSLITDATLLDYYNSAGLAWTASIDNKEHPQYSIFGGGYGPNTLIKGNTIVTMQCGKDKDGELDFDYAAQKDDRASWDNTVNEMRTEWNDDVNESDKNNLYGGTNSAGLSRYIASRMAWSSGITNLIHKALYGGGYAGLVGGNTNVHVSDYSCLRYLYGGGLGSREYLNKYNDPNDTQKMYQRLGEVGGSTKVVIEGGIISGEVYGGGAGMESAKINEADADLTDFVDMARVKQSTFVRLPKTASTVLDETTSRATLIFGDVFGGGDVANVGTKSGVAYTDANGDGDLTNDLGYFTSIVKIEGGSMMGQVFAGGNGRLKQQCSAEDGYKNLGAVYGNTLLDIDGYDASSNAANNTASNKGVTYIFKRVFGGGNNGSIHKTDNGEANSGNAYVVVKGGYLAYNVFGGGVGTVGPAEEGKDNNTYSYIDGSTYVDMQGGLAIVDQYWDKPDESIGVGTRQWAPLHSLNGKMYSAQYDPEAKKLLINHNIYAGCRNAGWIMGDTHLKMSKSYLRSSMRARFDVDVDATGYNFFETDEWKEIYEKIGSPHFCIFGGGYGANTHVKGDTWVDINISKSGLISPEDLSEEWASLPEEERYKKFQGGQSVMDVIGGGYSGETIGNTHVKVRGESFMRRVFGGAFYAECGSTNVAVESGNIDDVFGGGMMGDVRLDANVVIGQEPSGADPVITAANAKSANAKIYILKNVYGANDVAGIVGGRELNDGEIHPTASSEGIKINLNGGHIYGNVYGGGNGNYLYMIDQKADIVEAVEHYTDEIPLLYKVPIRKNVFPSLNAMSDAQKIVNISTYRPVALKTSIDFKGNATDDLLRVDGGIFGGGNSATISNYDNSFVHLNVGSHIRVGKVFLGSDGDAMFDNTTGFMDSYAKLNGLNINESIDWIHNPSNVDIPQTFLSTPKEARPNVYKNVLDLYFMPVEMNFMPEVTWGTGRLNSSLTSNDGNIDAKTNNIVDGLITDATIGTFCCGGNRGNMNTTTPFHMYFPAGLTITENIIGGCNNSNYTPDDDSNVSHEGGFLLGTHAVGKPEDHTPQIQLTMFNQFRPTKEDAAGKVITDDSNPHMYREGINVYGGCYQSGTVRGDILVDLRSNMIQALDSAALRRSTDDGRTVASIYGAGYGDQTWVYGDTEVRLGLGTNCTAEGSKIIKAYEAGNTSAATNYMFGGGRMGNLIGNTTVRVLNGRVAGCLVGASYAGVLYGNAQTMVGYPEVYYRTNGNYRFKLKRADMSEAHAAYVDDAGNALIKKEVRYTKGDLVSKAVYDEIVGVYINDAWTDINETQKASYFETPEHSIPAGNDWSGIDIQIDKAIYGGGYALASGSSVGSGSYTVKKYTATNRFKDDVVTDTYEFENADDIAGYGGNTFIMVGDVTGNYDILAGTGITAENSRDHIALSSRSLEPVATKTGDDLFGLFYQQTKYEVASDDEKSSITAEEKDQPTGPFIQYRSEAPKAGNDPHVYYRFVGEGGLYGDGHLSLSEGFRICDAMGYGYNGTHPQDPKLMNCIHRFDIARFKDCCVTLLGDRDYASVEGSEASASSYSVARVSEVQMESSLPQDQDYKNFKANDATRETKVRSRNYIGLSNAQFELGAIVSNDPFTENGALYHDKYGKVIASEMDIEGAGKKFTTTESYYNVKKWYLSEYKINSEDSKYYDDINAQVKNESLFQLRNSATARNMFGIFSGFALNVVNNHYDSEAKEWIPFYGPVIGVFEVDLVGVRDGEAGGYAYAQNIHEEKIGGDGEHKDEPTFLETSGNFVFPSTDSRKVIDNCFPGNYTASNRASADGHYWYVTGFRYFFNATLTGYTNDAEAMHFDMDNSARLIFLPGAKQGQPVTLKDFYFLNRHTSEEKQANCDIENHLLTKTGTETDWENASGEYYNLSLSISDKTTMDRTDDVPHIEYLKQDATEEKNDGTETYSVFVPQNKPLGNTTCDAPQVAIQLTDYVKNNGLLEDGTTYFSKHLEDPCTAVVVLTVPATNSSNQPIYDNKYYSQINPGTGLVSGKQYYALDEDGNKYEVTYEQAETIHSNNRDLFEMQYPAVGTDDVYDSKLEYYTKDTNGLYTLWNPGDKATAFESAKSTLFYKPEPKMYEYNLTLTIRYIKGPSYTGGITVQNCALPGEMIRLSSSTVKIISDAYSLPFDKGYWTFGPGEKVWVDEADHSKGYHWKLADLTGTSGTDANSNPLPNPDTKNLYYPFNPNVSAKEGNISEEFKGRVYFDDNTQDLYIPAYYFMDGYVAQYSFKVQGIDAIYDVTINPQDTLEVHNYHRMRPMLGGTKVNTAIRHAAIRSNEDAKRFTDDKINSTVGNGMHYASRPRVYIEDLDDFNEFVSYVNNDSTVCGSDIDFMLMTDIDASKITSWTAMTNFKGTLHGNGHVIKSMGADDYLFAANQGNIYNLGLEKGKITSTETPSLYPSLYHCCYTRANNTVYRMDGTTATTYTDDDWLYGKVTYDLNQYYLEARLDNNSSNHSSSTYVEDIYRNGDYQYARYRNNGQNNEYLRTLNAPRYVVGNFQSITEIDKAKLNTEITRHITAHTVDSLRADGYVATHLATEADVTNGIAQAVDDEVLAYKAGDYRPLFESREITADAVAESVEKRNDYLFFGQYLNNVTTEVNNRQQIIPSALANTERKVSTMSNRVYRAFGFYGSKADDSFHFNTNAYAMQPTLTAIDFTGAHDGSNVWNTGTHAGIYYPKMMDMPTSLLSFHVLNGKFPAANGVGGVSRNIIVYTDNSDAPIVSYSAVNNELRYAQSTKESAIKGHQAYLSAGYQANNGLLHLVERNANDENGDGEPAALNNDFNAPIPFTVTERAWYTRRPLYYAEKTNSAWEGITLPFPVNKVTSWGGNYEMSHFYGSAQGTGNADTATDGGTNTHDTGHEYWLRGLVTVGDKENSTSEKNATFKRPAVSGTGYFIQGSTTGTYTYSSDYFNQTYGRFYGNHDVYGEDRTYVDYAFQSAHVPYIVSFPGKAFKEFDLSGEYNDWLMSEHKDSQYPKDNGTSGSHQDWSGLNKEAQSVTFNYYVTNDAVTAPKGSVTIPVTDEQTNKTTIATPAYSHVGTFAHIAKSASIYAFGEDSNDGTLLEKNAADVLPFRTYMTASTSGAKIRYIYITDGSTAIEDVMEDDSEAPAEQETMDRKLRIYLHGHTICIDSNYATDLRVFSVSGLYIRTLHVEEGANQYSDFQSGIYIVGNKKIIIQ